jgi:hypothetical protein
MMELLGKGAADLAGLDGRLRASLFRRTFGHNGMGILEQWPTDRAAQRPKLALAAAPMNFRSNEFGRGIFASSARHLFFLFWPSCCLFQTNLGSQICLPKFVNYFPRRNFINR